MKGSLEELDAPETPYRPVLSWKEHVQRAVVKAQNNQYMSKYDHRGSAKGGRKQNKFEVFMLHAET